MAFIAQPCPAYPISLATTWRSLLTESLQQRVRRLFKPATQIVHLCLQALSSDLGRQILKSLQNAFQPGSVDCWVVGCSYSKPPTAEKDRGKHKKRPKTRNVYEQPLSSSGMKKWIWINNQLNESTRISIFDIGINWIIDCVFLAVDRIFQAMV